MFSIVDLFKTNHSCRCAVFSHCEFNLHWSSFSYGLDIGHMYYQKIGLFSQWHPFLFFHSFFYRQNLVILWKFILINFFMIYFLCPKKSLPTSKISKNSLLFSFRHFILFISLFNIKIHYKLIFFFHIVNQLFQHPFWTDFPFPIELHWYQCYKSLKFSSLVHQPHFKSSRATRGFWLPYQSVQI